jgi:TPR repeat protein
MTSCFSSDLRWQLEPELIKTFVGSKSVIYSPAAASIIRLACGTGGPTQLLRAAVMALLMLAAVEGAAVAGPLEDARLRADQGDAMAQIDLGHRYKWGVGVPADYAEAVKWYRRAADQGSMAAQWLLAQMYVDGYGVEQDYVQAHMWFNLSAAQGFEGAAAARAELERKMTRAQIAEAQKLARGRKPKSER